MTEKEAKFKLSILDGTPLKADHTLSVENVGQAIHIKDNCGKVVISFNPFNNSVWLTDPSQIIIGEDQEIDTNPHQIKQNEEDSKKLETIRKARDYLKEEMI